MDSLSLTQVKEMCIVTHNSTSVGSNMHQYFDTWWSFSAPSLASSAASIKVEYESTRFQTTLASPCWSTHTADHSPDHACSYPLASDIPYPHNMGHQLEIKLNPSSPDSTSFVSGSPPEVLGDHTSRSRSELRTWDLDSLLYTIRSASPGGHVFLAVMDYMPASLYSSGTVSGNTVWWSSLNDVLLEVQYAKNVSVSMLVSNWAHSRAVQWQQLSALKSQGGACPTSGTHACGSFDVRVYEVPGWNETAAEKADLGESPYAPYSRVAHGKFIVSDQRANIGTSNMAWDYFFATAGSSFNTDDVGIVGDLNAAFLRDWDSSYSTPLDKWMERARELPSL